MVHLPANSAFRASAAALLSTAAALVAACTTAGPPTSTSTPLVEFSRPEIKYALLEAFPAFFWCDPDMYPVSRGDEQEKAIARFPAISQDEPEITAILERLGIGAGPTSDEQKLQIYREHKRLGAVVLEGDGAAGPYEFSIRIADDRTSGRAIAGTVDRYGEVTVRSTEPAIATCPICLVAGTMIDTPHGMTAVQDLRTGMPVWTRGLAGGRIAATVILAQRVAYEGTASVARIELADGRFVTASAGHPTADGTPIGSLVPGDVLDGARVRSVQAAAPTSAYSYDVLPSGPTGTYWADGILLRSSMWSD